MPGGILKRERAQQGQAVHLEARPALGQAFEPMLPGGSGNLEVELAAPTPVRAVPVRQTVMEQAQQEALSAAEQIRAEAEQMAAEIAGQAAQEASEIIERTTEEISLMRQAAEEELAARRAQLEQQVRAELSTEYQERYLKALQALESAAAKIQKSQAEYLAALETPAFELVLGIARQVLSRELGDAALSLPALIAQAFHLLKPQQPLTVRVGPVTFQQLSESELFAHALTSAGVRLERVELEIDSALGEGQFRAESAGSYIDCDLPALLSELTAHLSAQAQLGTDAAGAAE
jgi:flagellar biosynthesis/type III secretory pathway protein FliH